MVFEGIRYVTNSKGEKVAVLIDLEIHSDLWEDFHDALVAESRKDEPRESLKSVKERLHRSGKLDG